MIGTKWCQCKYGSYFRIEKKRFKFFILAKMFKVWMIGNYKWDYNYLGKFFRKGFMFENSSLLLLQTRLSCSSITLSGSSLFIKHSLDFQDEGKNLSHQSITFSNEAFDCKRQIFSSIKDGRSYNRGTDDSHQIYKINPYKIFTKTSWKFNCLRLCPSVSLRLEQKSFKRTRNSFSVSSSWVHTNMSSMYRYQSHGLKNSPSKNCISILSIEIQAYGGVNLLPMTMLDTCCIALELIFKKLFSRTNSAIYSESFLSTSLFCCCFNLAESAIRLSFPVGIYLVKVNNRNTRIRCEICSMSTIKTPERYRRSGVFIVKFEHISHLVLVFLLLTQNM